jgi:hypothetical protein
MPPRVRKAALCVHVICSVGLIGAVCVFLALAITGLASEDVNILRAVYPAMDMATWAMIVPLCLGSLASGIVQSLGTEWGLLRHYWVVIKLLLSLFATIVLLLQTEAIGYVATMASREAFSATDLLAARTSLAAHATGGLVVLLTAVVLSIFKPRGITSYGATKRP